MEIQSKMLNCKLKYDIFNSRLDHTIKELESNSKSIVNDLNQNMSLEIQNLFKNIIEKDLRAKQTELEEEFNQEMKDLSQLFDRAKSKAIEFRQNVESKVKSLENLMQELQNIENSNLKRQQQQQHDPSELEYDEDALMINDSIDYFSTDLDLNNNTTDLVSKIDIELKSLDEIFNKANLLENFFNNIKASYIQLVKCDNNNKLNDLCFGHFKVNDIDENLELCQLDKCEHTSFKLETDLSRNVSFFKSKKNFITFVADHSTASSNPHDINVMIVDPDNKQLTIDLKQRQSNYQIKYRIYFVPKEHGMHRLIFKYKNRNITNSPFYFFVQADHLTHQHQHSTVSASLNTSFENMEISKTDNIIKHHTESNNQLINDQNQNQHQQQQPNSDFRPVHTSFGRGQMLKVQKMFMINGQNNPTSSAALNPTSSGTQAQHVFSSTKSQKRKSLTNQYSQIKQDFMEPDDESMDEAADKSKKLIFDESNNIVHNYSIGSDNSSLNYCAGGPELTNIISNHLKKYSMSNRIPNLKAKLERKFNHLKFPIGVRSCKIRNWLIVCESGNNSIKVFERTSGELLHTIADKHPYTLQRPSAVLINYENNREVYIKDDKEILVFDLEQNFKFIRSFGAKLLFRPFGLAFDSQGNIVVVDANNRHPKVVTFNKETGQIINSKPYRPVIKECADSDKLKYLFSNQVNQNLLGDKLFPFDRTKIRFICSNGNSLYGADLGRSIIFKTNFSGELELAFGKFGSSHGEFKEPSGIHVESDGSCILVGDSKNDRVQVYDNEGKYKFNIDFLPEKVIRPSDIYVDSDGYLYISCYLEHCVKKYKLITE